jgi:hypothetical protein
MLLFPFLAKEKVRAFEDEFLKCCLIIEASISYIRLFGFFVTKPSSQGTDSHQINSMYDVHEPNNVSVAAIQSATGTRPAVYSPPEVIKPGQGSYRHSSLQR